MELEELLGGFFVDWYRRHGRHFPWRESSTTPFGVLIAELMLRKTKAEMVAEVWPGFIAAYPHPSSCVVVKDELLLEILGPLGFGNLRVKAIKDISVLLVSRYEDNVPESISELTSLPHVGIYAANAVACFAFGQTTPIVDSNVMRILCRLYGRKMPKDIRRAPEVWDLATRILPVCGIREHNYGLLDFGAQVCKSRNPICNDCSLSVFCPSHSQNRQG
jgi:A/G-specific adenine glycosylase